VVRSSPQSVGKPGLGAARNLALGVIASLAEAGVAESAYHDTARMLDDLLSQIAKNDDADEAEWEAIRDKLNEIANMKQSWLGAAWEFVSFGQRSVVEKQAAPGTSERNSATTTNELGVRSFAANSGDSRRK